jgi:hypothetical protein
VGWLEQEDGALDAGVSNEADIDSEHSPQSSPNKLLNEQGHSRCILTPHVSNPYFSIRYRASIFVGDISNGQHLSPDWSRFGELTIIDIYTCSIIMNHLPTYNLFAAVVLAL